MKIPALTTDQMIDVDRLMIEDYGIQLIQMMENAGRNVAELAYRMLGQSLYKKRVTILCGSGNNGGGGMVAARHLHNRGANVNVTLVGELEKLKEIPLLQWRIIKNMGLNRNLENFNGTELLIDAMIGYGLSGDPRPPFADWIHKANLSGHPILSIDTPSGLDTTSGKPGNPCIQATATLTLALPKTGLLSASATSSVGELYVGDISVPPELYSRLNLRMSPIFEDEIIIKLT